MKLLLGCGNDIRKGWVHHDLSKHSPHVDIAFDLEMVPWPLDDEVATKIKAQDVLEHLFDTVQFMDECWRVMKPGGKLSIRVPHYQGKIAWRDPTHKRAFHPQTFDWFDPGKKLGRKYGTLYTFKHWRVMRVRLGVGKYEDIKVRLKKIAEG